MIYVIREKDKMGNYKSTANENATLHLICLHVTNSQHRNITPALKKIFNRENIINILEGQKEIKNQSIFPNDMGAISYMEFLSLMSCFYW